MVVIVSKTAGYAGRAQVHIEHEIRLTAEFSVNGTGPVDIVP